MKNKRNKEERHERRRTDGNEEKMNSAHITAIDTELSRNYIHSIYNKEREDNKDEIS